MLGDIIKHMTPDRAFEYHYPQVRSISAYKASVLFSLPRKRGKERGEKHLGSQPTGEGNDKGMEGEAVSLFPVPLQLSVAPPPSLGFLPPLQFSIPYFTVSEVNFSVVKKITRALHFVNNNEFTSGEFLI